MSIPASHDIYNSTLFKQAYWRSLRAHIDRLIQYQAVVGVFGKVETGKTTLCHLLLGRDINELETIDPNTTSPQEFTLAYKNGKGLALIDMPGFGNTQSNDQLIDEIYELLMPEIDLVIWVTKANDPDLQVDLEFYQRTLAIYTKQRTVPVLLVVNEFQLHQLGNAIQALIQPHFGQVRECAISTKTGAGVYQLLEQILGNLPLQRRRKNAV